MPRTKTRWSRSKGTTSTSTKTVKTTKKERTEPEGDGFGFKVSTEDIMNFTEDCEVHPDALDIDWVELPSAYGRYASLLADADAEVQRQEVSISLLEEDAKVCRSEIILEVSENPDLLGDGVKATALTMEAYYRRDSKHKSLKKDILKLTDTLITSKHRANLLRNAVFAMQMKKTALENLVRLVMGEYFASPSVPRDLKEELRLRRERTRTDARSNIWERLSNRK